MATIVRFLRNMGAAKEGDIDAYDDEKASYLISIGAAKLYSADEPFSPPEVAEDVSPPEVVDDRERTGLMSRRTPNTTEGDE